MPFILEEEQQKERPRHQPVDQDKKEVEEGSENGLALAADIVVVGVEAAVAIDGALRVELLETLAVS